MCEQLQRVTTGHLHRHHPLVTQEFVEVSVSVRLQVCSPRVMRNVGNISVCCLQLKDGESTGRVTMTDKEREVKAWEERVDAVVRALRPGTTGDSGGQSVSGVTMVFCNTNESCAEMASCLRDRGVACGEFHKNVPSHTREAVLEAFSEGRQVSVLVCTDAASRWAHYTTLLFSWYLHQLV